MAISTGYKGGYPLLETFYEKATSLVTSQDLSEVCVGVCRDEHPIDRRVVSRV